MDIINSIKERRSINFFEPNQEIPSAKIKELIELATLAPSSMNLQPWKTIVVSSHDMKQKLMKLAFNQPKYKKLLA